MTLKKTLLSALAALLLLATAHTAPQAEELTGTLKKIKETGVITVGHRESSVPFSYYDLQQNVIGYSQDYSNKIVDAALYPLHRKTAFPFSRTAPTISNVALPPTMPTASSKSIFPTPSSLWVPAC